MDAVARPLFIFCDGVKNALRAGCKTVRQFQLFEQAAQSPILLSCQQAFFNRYGRRHHHAPADGLAMRSASCFFNRMAEGVAEVQQTALAFFGFVSADNR